MERYRLLEKKLRDYDYETSERNQNGYHIAENHGTPYPMIDTFYELGEGKYPENNDGFFLPPEQKEYVNYMFKRCQRYAEGKHEERFTEKYRDGWIERFKRSWASFVRDVHFSFLSSAKNVFEKQRYTLKEDIENNADLIGVKGNVDYRVSLFIDSKKGRKNLNRKIKDDYDRITKDLIVPLRPDGVKYIVQTQTDKLWLYSNTHIIAVRTLINSTKSSILLEDEKTKIELI